MNAHIEGLIAAPFTPMTGEGRLNLEVVEAYQDFLQRSGVAGVFVCGTTGEGLSLTAQERMDVARRWVEVAPDGFKVIVHTGHTSPAVAQRLAAHAGEIGAWGIGAMGPCFYRPGTVEDLAAFCGEVAAAAPNLPFYYYHIPSMTHIDLPMVEFLKAAGDRIPNLAGVKYTHEDLMDFELCRGLDNGRFDMLFGRDEMLLAALALGARGAVGSTYNFAAPLYTRLIEAFDAGDLDAARRLQRRSMEMVRLLQAAPCSFLAAEKAVMRMMGIDCGAVRRPLRPITRELGERLEAELRENAFFDY